MWRKPYRADYPAFFYSIFVCFPTKTVLHRKERKKTPTCQKKNFESVNPFLPNFPLPSIIDYKS